MIANPSDSTVLWIAAETSPRRFCRAGLFDAGEQSALRDLEEPLGAPDAADRHGHGAVGHPPVLGDPDVQEMRSPRFSA